MKALGWQKLPAVLVGSPQSVILQDCMPLICVLAHRPICVLAHRPTLSTPYRLIYSAVTTEAAEKGKSLQSLSARFPAVTAEVSIES